jgi:hypothetical protein
MIHRNQNKGVAIFSNAFFYILSLNFSGAENLLFAISFTPNDGAKGYRCTREKRTGESIRARAFHSTLKIALPIRAKLSGRCSLFKLRKKNVEPMNNEQRILN